MIEGFLQGDKPLDNDQEGNDFMTIKQLKSILDHFDDDKEVIIFDIANSSVEDIESVSDNNGHLQINYLRLEEGDFN